MEAKAKNKYTAVNANFNGTSVLKYMTASTINKKHSSRSTFCNADVTFDKLALERFSGYLPEKFP
jgi:hypothetical protein